MLIFGHINVRGLPYLHDLQTTKNTVNISGCNLVSLIYVEDEIFSDWVEETNISLSKYRVIESQMKQVTFCFVIALIISRVQVLEKCDYK